MCNIEEFEKALSILVTKCSDEIEKLIKDYDQNMFMSEFKISVNEIPLASFHLLTQESNVSIGYYNVSEGTQNLSYRDRIGSWTEINYNSVELKESKDSED
jgi:hypothetical protein